MTRRPGGFGLGARFRPPPRDASRVRFAPRVDPPRATSRRGAHRPSGAHDPRRDRAPRLLLLLRSFVFFQTLGVHGDATTSEVRRCTPRRRKRRRAAAASASTSAFTVVAQRRGSGTAARRALVVGVRRRVRGVHGPWPGRRERARHHARGPRRPARAARCSRGTCHRCLNARLAAAAATWPRHSRRRRAWSACARTRRRAGRRRISVGRRRGTSSSWLERGVLASCRGGHVRCALPSSNRGTDAAVTRGIAPRASAPPCRSKTRAEPGAPCRPPPRPPRCARGEGEGRGAGSSARVATIVFGMVMGRAGMTRARGGASESMRIDDERGRAAAARPVHCCLRSSPRPRAAARRRPRAPFGRRSSTRSGWSGCGVGSWPHACSLVGRKKGAHREARARALPRAHAAGGGRAPRIGDRGVGLVVLRLARARRVAPTPASPRARARRRDRLSSSGIHGEHIDARHGRRQQRGGRGARRRGEERGVVDARWARSWSLGRRHPRRLAARRPPCSRARSRSSWTARPRRAGVVRGRAPRRGTAASTLKTWILNARADEVLQRLRAAGKEEAEKAEEALEHARQLPWPPCLGARGSSPTPSG